MASTGVRAQAEAVAGESVRWLCDVLPAGSWAGQPIAVLASGLGAATPSLADFSGRVIGVNAAAAWHPCDLAVSADEGFWDRAAPGLDLLGARRVFVSTHPKRADCWCVRAQQRRPGRLRWPAPVPDRLGYGCDLVTGGSSGLAALCLADVLGDAQSTIYLIGHVLEHPHRYALWRQRYEEIAEYVADRCVVVGHSALPWRWRWPRGGLPPGGR